MSNKWTICGGVDFPKLIDKHIAAGKRGVRLPLRFRRVRGRARFRGTPTRRAPRHAFPRYSAASGVATCSVAPAPPSARVAGEGYPPPETRHPKPETRNPKPGTRNPKSETPNPQTFNPQLGTHTQRYAISRVYDGGKRMRVEAPPAAPFPPAGALQVCHLTSKGRVFWVNTRRSTPIEVKE